MKLFFAVIFFAISPLNSFAQENIDNSLIRNTAEVQILDKTTAKASVVDLKIGEEINFDSLVIIAHKCWQAPLDQRPESKILLEVSEKTTDKDGEKEERVFYGWIFASSPSISGLEHPIYDITALNCKNK